MMQHHLELWNCDGTPEFILRTLCAAAREQAGRQASRTTVIIDTQCAKGSQKLRGRGHWSNVKA